MNVSAPGSTPPPNDPARRRDKLLGLLIIAGAFAISLGISLWAKQRSRPELAKPPAPPTTAGVVGFPKAVDAIATLPAARAVTPRPALLGIALERVGPNGTVDVTDDKGRVRYTFQSPAGEGPQPAREPGTLPRRHYCGRQIVRVKAQGLVADPDISDYPCPGSPAEGLPDPVCGPKEVWQRAIDKGVPDQRPANIDYYRSKAGPAWRFDLPGTQHRFALYGDCERELARAESAAAVRF